MAGLSAAVESVRRLPDAPDAVLISGDLAEHAADDEYEIVGALLAQLGAPVYVLPAETMTTVTRSGGICCPEQWERRCSTSRRGSRCARCWKENSPRTSNR